MYNSPRYESALAVAVWRSPLTPELYQDYRGEWRWRLRSSNGRTVADSGEGYKSKEDCLHGLTLVSNWTL